MMLFTTRFLKRQRATLQSLLFTNIHIPLFSAVIFLYGDSLFGSDVSTGYGAPTSSYGAPEASYGAPEASYGAPAASYGAPAPAYGAPSYAANRYYVSLEN